MKSSNSGVVASLAYQGDTSGPRGESNGQQLFSYGSSCNDAPQADERNETKEKINLRHNLRTGTWNVRSMTDPSKLHILQRELNRCKIPICGLSEDRWIGKGHFRTDDGCTVYFSGSDRLRRNGVGFIMSRQSAKSILGYNPISDRIISIRLQAKPINISIIQVDIVIIMGDFNAKVGSNLEKNHAMGRFGLGHANERGEKLVDFCIENDLVLTNTLFPQHPRRLYRPTWISPDGNYRNQIGLDYILIIHRWRSSVKVAKTYPGADCDSDHQLLTAEIRCKLKIVKRDALPRRYDVKQINDQYQAGVRNSFKVILKKEKTWKQNELWELTKNAISLAARKNLPKLKKCRAPWISDKVVALADERLQIKANGLHNGDGTILIESHQIKDRWKEYCQRLYDSKYSDQVIKAMEVDQHDMPNILRSEVEFVIKKIKDGKTPEYDDIPAELLKETGDEAFDTVQNQRLWNVLIAMGFPRHVVELLRTLYDNQEAAMRTACGDSTWFKIKQGVRQGCILSPNLFNVYAEYIMRLAL
ncbi:uncharacterized protein [Antedon mediterranea]|uniref:uncharacterized protein n=1 Tax=Antedon mediterranea TaxID=105859 RepID=UPI003AF9C369